MNIILICCLIWLLILTVVLIVLFVKQQTRNKPEDNLDDTLNINTDYVEKAQETIKTVIDKINTASEIPAEKKESINEVYKRIINDGLTITYFKKLIEKIESVLDTYYSQTSDLMKDIDKIQIDINSVNDTLLNSLNNPDNIDLHYIELYITDFDVDSEKVEDWKKEQEKIIKELDKIKVDSLKTTQDSKVKNAINAAFTEIQSNGFISSIDVVNFKLSLYKPLGVELMSKLLQEYEEFNKQRGNSLQIFKKLYDSEKSKYLTNSTRTQQIRDTYYKIINKDVITAEDIDYFKNVCDNGVDSDNSSYDNSKEKLETALIDIAEMKTQVENTRKAVFGNEVYNEDKYLGIVDKLNDKIDLLENINKVDDKQSNIRATIQKYIKDYVKANSVNQQMLNETSSKLSAEIINKNNESIKNAFDSVYPVGAVLIRYDDKNPTQFFKSIFGIDSTWERLPAGYLYSTLSNKGYADDGSLNNEAKGTFSTEGHALTTDEMPSHSHSLNSVKIGNAGNHEHDIKIMHSTDARYKAYVANVIRANVNAHGDIPTSGDTESINWNSEYIKTSPFSGTEIDSVGAGQKALPWVYFQAKAKENGTHSHSFSGTLSAIGSNKTHSHEANPRKQHVVVWRRVN